MKAFLKNYRQSPRKVRLVGDLVKGKKVDYALDILKHTTKRAAPTISKLIKSAVANAKDHKGLASDQLKVKNITVDEGVTMKRFMPRAFGTSYTIRKRMSHVAVSLDVDTSTKVKKANRKVVGKSSVKKIEEKVSDDNNKENKE